MVWTGYGLGCGLAVFGSMFGMDWVCLVVRFVWTGYGLGCGLGVFGMDWVWTWFALWCVWYGLTGYGLGVFGMDWEYRSLYDTCSWPTLCIGLARTVYLHRI